MDPHSGREPGRRSGRHLCPRRASKAWERPALRIDCGTEDGLLEENRQLHAHLQKIGYPHEYLEAPGAHDWGYWDVHVQEAIAFHARNLGIEKVKPPVAAPRAQPTKRG